MKRRSADFTSLLWAAGLSGPLATKSDDKSIADRFIEAADADSEALRYLISFQSQVQNARRSPANSSVVSETTGDCIAGICR